MENAIYKLRKELNLSQEKFGEKLGVGKTAISKLEKGYNNLSEQMIKAICREYNVSEEWLRTGEGEIFVKPDDQFGAALGKIIDTDDEFIKEMFFGIANMSQADRDILKKAIEVIKKSNIF